MHIFSDESSTMNKLLARVTKPTDILQIPASQFSDLLQPDATLDWKLVIDLYRRLRRCKEDHLPLLCTASPGELEKAICLLLRREGIQTSEYAVRPAYTLGLMMAVKEDLRWRHSLTAHTFAALRVLSTYVKLI